MSEFTDDQLKRASDQLLIDERQDLIAQASDVAGQWDGYGNFMLWFDETCDTSYRMRGIITKSGGYHRYSLAIQTGEADASKLLFDEKSARIEAVDGPLHNVTQNMSDEARQIYLGSIVHRALGNLIAEEKSSAAHKQSS